MAEKEKKTDEQVVEEKAKAINESLDNLRKAIKEKDKSIEDLTSKYDDISGKLDEVVGNEDFNKQQEQLDEISEILKKMQETRGRGPVTLKDNLQKQLESEEFARHLKATPKTGEIASFEVEKAASIDPDDVNSGTIETQTEPGVAYYPWRDNPIWNSIMRGTIGAGRDSVSWWERTTSSENADMVDNWDDTPSASAMTWTKQSMDIKMIKDYTKVARAAMEDFEYMQSEISDLINHGIPRKRETQLLEGDGTGNNLKGIEEYAKAFAKPSNFNKVAVPNEADVLAAAILQVQNGNTSKTNQKGWQPNLILLNPGSVWNMQLIKKDDGTYLLPPFMAQSGLNVGGVRVVTSLDLGADEFLVGDFRMAKAYLKRKMRVSFHYENEDDVLNDLVLVLASERIAGVKITTPGAYAFVHGTFTAGKSAIEKVVA